jgi:hypothetical protein
MAFKHVLKSSLQPTILLVELAVWDDDLNTGAYVGTRGKAETLAYKSPKSNRGNAKETGSGAPFVQINDFILGEGDIESLILDESDFIPKITIIYEDTSGYFSPVQFPNKNPILSIYVKSTHEKMKPIRNDYIITSIRGGSTKIIKGELFIPGIYTNVSKSFNQSTSRDVLFKTCQDLGLGFQENQSSPSDAMNWINPNWNSKSFMKHVISHSYQNDQSFFDAFIDKYYHLNYIDANIQLEQDGEFDNTIFTGDIDFDISEEISPDTSKVMNSIPMGLVENPLLRQGTQKIKSRHLITENGDILTNSGFKKRIYYYDPLAGDGDPIDNEVDFYVQPIVSTKPIGKERDLTPVNEFLKEMEVKKWVGVQYKNMHQNYIAARAINSHNMKELNKIKLKVETTGINFNATRGMRIPVGIYESAAEAQWNKSFEGKDNNTPEIKASADSIVYNEYLSGIYYSLGNRYIYEKDMGFKTELTLSRRDWIPNPAK